MSKVYHDSLPTTRTCTRCHLEKPLSEFYKASRERLGVRAQCKVCVDKQDEAKRKQEAALRPPPATTKVCKICRTEKPLEAFHAASSWYCQECRANEEHQKYVQKANRTVQQLPLFTFSKVCRVCQIEKHLDQFSPSKECSYGVVGTCKGCVKNRIQKTSATRSPFTHRVCLECKKDKPIEEFHSDKTRTSGYKERCKECEKPRIRENSKRHYKNNTVCYAERHRKNREENPEYHHKYHATHREQHRVNGKRWRVNNPLKVREVRVRRVAQKKHTEVEKVDYARILERDGYWCHICSKPILPHHLLHFDHVIPLRRNGSHTEDNIKPSHGVCNDRKGTQLLSEMKPWQRRGPDDLQDTLLDIL